MIAPPVPRHARPPRARHIARVATIVAIASVASVAACARGDRPLELAVLPDSSPAEAGAAEPNLAPTPDGRVLMSWLVPTDDSATAMRFSVREPDGTWWEPREVMRRRDLFVNWADFPSIIELGDGRLLAHWLQRNGSGRYAYDVRVAESRDGGKTWGASVTPHTPGIEAEHGFVAMLPMADSGAGMVLLDGGAGSEDAHGAQMHLAYAAWTATGLGARTVIDHRVCDCCQTALAMTTKGPVVAYRDRSDGEVRDISVVRLVDGAWTEPRAVHADGWKIDFCPVNGPAISAVGDTVAVALFAAPNDSGVVRVAFSRDAGATFDAAVRVDGGKPTGRVDVELVDGRTALVSWIERVGEKDAQVWARVVRADGTLEAPLVVGGSEATRSSGFPRMARIPGGVLMAWTVPGTPSAVRTAVVRTGAEP